MGKYVWVSDAQADPDLILPFEADLAVNDPDLAAEASRNLKAGRPLSESMFAREIWASANAGEMRSLPNLFYANGHWIVSSAAAAIIAQFDLGGGALGPVRIFQHDRSTSLPGEYLCWSFGNVKSALVPDRSRDLRPFGIAGLRWKMPFAMADDVVAVDAAAADGPAVWIDPTLSTALFVSGGLGDALDQAGFRKHFRLYRAPLVA